LPRALHRHLAGVTASISLLTAKSLIMQQAPMAPVA